LAKGTYIEAEILESQAYLSLSGISPQVLFLFLLKRQFEKVAGKKNGRQKRVCINANSLSLTYIEAKEKYGITQPRLTRAIDDLLAKGFLTCIRQGGAYQQDKSIYGLSEKWRMWRPGVILESRKNEPVKRGYRKPKIEHKLQN
jgi:hypothetical protein